MRSAEMIADNCNTIIESKKLDKELLSKEIIHKSSIESGNYMDKLEVD